MMTISEVAKILQVHPNTLRRWEGHGYIPVYRINRRGDRRFKREDVEKLLTEMSNDHNNHKETSNGSWNSD